MRTVIFTYSDNVVTRHNAEGISTPTIAHLVGQTIDNVETIFDTTKRRIVEIEVSRRIIKAEIN